MKKTSFSKILMLLMFMTLFSLVSANMNIRVNPLDENGNHQYNETINYTLNFTNSYDCSSVLLSHEQTIFTNNSGSALISVDISSLSSPVNHVCEYRNGTLASIHNITDTMQNIISANYFKGDGSNLTNVNYTETDSKAYNGTLAYNSTFAYYVSLDDLLAFNFYNSTTIPTYLTTETDSLAYNGTLAYNSSLSNYYTKSEVTTNISTAIATKDECSEISGCVTGAITDLVSDTTPQLGGNLDAQSYNITAIDCITFTSGGKICSIGVV